MGKFAKLWVFTAIFIIHTASATQFTFDLEDGAEQCFYELIKENTFCTLEFYVSAIGIFGANNSRHMSDLIKFFTNFMIFSLEKGCKRRSP